jgi:glycosyltransferase involved in cell wall biosynthesis
MADTPILIPTFNNPTYLDGMLSQLRARMLSNILVIDNASTFPEMREYLSKLTADVRVIYLPENSGPRSILQADSNYASLPDVFCITDPDLELNADLPEDFLFQLLQLTEQYKVGKAGFSLDISNPEEMVQDHFVIGDSRCTIWDWEEQFWQRKLGTTLGGDPVYDAGIDTTFALYNKKYFDRSTPLRAIRVAGRFQCRHLPWYRATRLSTDEEEYYRATQKHSFYCASTTSPFDSHDSSRGTNAGPVSGNLPRPSLRARIKAKVKTLRSHLRLTAGNRGGQ